VADHTDYYGGAHGEKETISQAGFNCHCEDLVVSSPFIQMSLSLSLVNNTLYQEITASYNLFHYHDIYTTKDSRGPPSLV
jgi:hypothetical protein